MSESLKKIIELINKTGDNCLVLDNTGNPAYVLMPFSRYQKMVDEQKDIFAKSKNSLNQAKITPESNSEEDNYFFEPID